MRTEVFIVCVMGLIYYVNTLLKANMIWLATFLHLPTDQATLSVKLLLQVPPIASFLPQADCNVSKQEVAASNCYTIRLDLAAAMLLTVARLLRMRICGFMLGCVRLVHRFCTGAATILL